MKRLAALLFSMIAVSVSQAAPMHHQLPRPDGSLMDYWLDLPIGDPKGLIVLAQGSGCQPGMSNTSLAAARAAFSSYAAVIVEKYGVTPDAGIVDGFNDCPPAFHAGYTISQRVGDYRQVITVLQQDQRLANRLVLFGGSEGGLAVAMLAPAVEPDAVIILSSATGMVLSEVVRRSAPPEAQANIDAGFASARADPQGSKLFAGSSHRFWADILDHRALDYLLASGSPILLVQGGRDTSAPVAAARITVDAFAAAGRCNLTYLELPGLDHAMQSRSGTPRLASVVALAAEWAERPQETC